MRYRRRNERGESGEERGGGGKEGEEGKGRIRILLKFKRGINREGGRL